MPKKITGRTKQLSLKTTPEFHAKLKELAVKEKCLMIEILEQAVAFWEEQRKNNKENTIVREIVTPKTNKRSLDYSNEDGSAKRRKTSDEDW